MSDVKTITCDKCQRLLYYSNDNYYGDDVCKIDGLYLCEDCWPEYIKETYVVELTEGE